MRLILGLLLLTITQLAFAVVIPPNTIIDSPTLYNNTIIDLRHGNFIIKNNGSLVIRNSEIIGTLSPSNSTLIAIELGHLRLVNNNVFISAPLIAPHPYEQSMQYVIRAEKAKIELLGNHFKMEQAFAGGLLITNINNPTSNFIITNNNIENFHGVFYLMNASNALINNNILTSNSYGNIVLMGKSSKISQNKIYFSGRDKLGNAMDIIQSSDIDISDNFLFTPTCHGIYLFLSDNVAMENNNIVGGITYAITLLSKIELKTQDAYAVNLVDLKKANHFDSKNIIISHNFMSQNRYGIAATDIEHLVIKDNFFIQRFANASARKFWTDNTILLKNISDLVWINNAYKEAFTQDNEGSNSMTQIVAFPESGGVSL